ncbi:hypothetical protein N8835_05830 [Alphaproteobacteria bacterium]|nr:hypothetical protein [Alphaproteobacteria bacterium]
MRYLYLPIEIAIREFDSKLCLAEAASRQGWDVVIGLKRDLLEISHSLPPGIFLVKSCVPGELQQLTEIRTNGHRVVSLDEEGLVTYPRFLRDEVRFNAETLEAVDAIFSWGQFQADVLREVYPKARKKIHVTGNPRLEIWHRHTPTLHAQNAEMLRDKHGPFILFASGFGIANNYMKSKSGLELTVKHSGNIDSHTVDFLTGQHTQNTLVFHEYLKLIPKLLEALPDYKVVIRPHPSEAHSEWQSIADKFDNAILEYDGPITPYILAASALLQFKSTTSVEAHFIGRRSVTYLPKLPDELLQFNLPLPLAFSAVGRSIEQTILLLKDAVDNRKPVDVETLPDDAKKWIAYGHGHVPSQKIVEHMSSLAIETDRTLKIPKPRLFHSIKIKRIASKFLAMLPEQKVFLTQIITKAKSERDYGRHKLRGLSLEIGQQTLEAINPKRQQKLKRFYKNLFHLPPE